MGLSRRARRLTVVAAVVAATVTGAALAAPGVAASVAPQQSATDRPAAQPVLSVPNPLSTAISSVGSTRSNRPAPVVPVQPVAPVYDDAMVSVMARQNHRTIAQQRSALARQNAQNTTLARLQAAGYAFDGTFYTDATSLVVQARPGSAAAVAAKRAGLSVRSVHNGEARLNAIKAALDALPTTRSGIASYGVDIVRDRVDVTTSSATPDPAFLAATRKYGSAVAITTGAARNQLRTTVYPGDMIRLDQYGSYCSGGFPAHTKSGYHAMVWAGHCVEDGTNFYNAYGSPWGAKGPLAFRSYDGKPDRDIGIVWVNRGSAVSAHMETFGTGYFNPALKGLWKAPVGSFLCKAGTVTGVTCGRITAYNQTVTYSDTLGRTVATVTNLGKSSVCSASGDSGAAMEAGSYAVGMVSGGPANEAGCRRNGGYQPGYLTYFQPAADAYAYYQLIWN